MGCTDLKTPNLDRLAAMGAVFTDAHTTATVCSPSRAGLLTGRYQQRFGHECNIPPHGLGMSVTERTIADALKMQDYRTGIFGKRHLGETKGYHPNERGFDEFYGFLEGSRSYFMNEANDLDGDPHAVERNGERVDFDGYLTDVLGQKTLEFIKSTREQPFFAFLSFNAVHSPMEAKQEDLDMFSAMDRKTLAAMTWSMDEAIGEILDYLESSERLNNTLIFFLSDNGGANNNQSSCAPLKGWKGNKFEGGHRVPFVVTWPQKIPAGQRIDKLVSALDIFKTSNIVSGARDFKDKPLDGINLLPLMRGENKDSYHRELFWRKDEMAAVRDDHWKLIRLDDYGYRLYNLKEDLGEKLDLREKHPKQFAKMKLSLEAWEKQMVKPWWLESKAWSEVTWFIHKDLMENKPPRAMSPDELKK